MNSGIRPWEAVPDQVTENCSVSFLRRGIRVCVDVVHLDSGLEVSMIGPATAEDELKAIALQRIREHRITP
ncbi:hypothetical protein M2405_001327 [Rhodococcus erythropolis]|uniref:hypothetical protein n=1 Tax=Rhodococcus TaxID=1827 RepID=UPI002167BD10|nr:MULTISPECIES: hypothetical protein [Rhodococcus]MCS4253051.1 hypothetical protein [Rhodococcus erythropolis]MCW2428504.1 hypothetical protein [Rhodococcus erythropolis]MDV8128859.1 hypothetical protein [Rhodococcus sp. IEGM 1304]